MFVSIQKNGLRLAIFAIIATALVAITHELTKKRIQSQQQKQLQNVLNQVIPPKLHDNQLTQNCTLLPAQNKVLTMPLPAYRATLDGKPSAVAIETYAPDGYGGPIKLIVGLNLKGEVLGVRVLEHKETPGLGDKIDLRISDWILSFNHRSLTPENEKTWAVRKDGGTFDQFTGATITPRAVVKAVKKTLTFYQSNMQKTKNKQMVNHIFEQTENCGA